MCNKSYLIYLSHTSVDLAASIASVVIGGFTGDEEKREDYVAETAG